MSQAKRGRLFFRDSRSATFLYKAAAMLIAPANASPFTTSTRSSTSPITSSLPKATGSSSKSDRDGSFRVLADGTQDLAALVGIFATNSVERYAFDYSRGHLSSAVSMLSLLGLLGYVRALVKLAMGPEACENAGFDMKALRPMLGVSDTDQLPTDKVYEMHYMERHTDGSHITWKRIRNTKHTMDSSALGEILGHLDNKDPRAYLIYGYSDVYSYEMENKQPRIHPRPDGNRLFRSTRGDIFVLLVSFLCVVLTSCLIIPLRGSSRPQWNLYVATLGLFVPVFSTTLMWAWVYAQEQLPLHTIDEDAQMSEIKYFAYLTSKTQHLCIVVNLRAVAGHTRWGLRTMSLVAALSAIAGYVCQYIEVRRMSARNAGIWLATQGALAVIRLSIWIIDPAFDDHKFIRGFYHGSRFSELRLGLVSDECIGTQFRIPVWAAQSIQATTSNDFYQPFTMALSTYLGRQDPRLDLMAELKNATKYWDMPDKLFKSWVDTHCHLDLPLLKSNEPPETVIMRYHSARVILDQDGKFHVLPFYRMHSESDEYSCMLYELKLFGNLKDEASTVVCIRGRGNGSITQQPWKPEEFTLGLQTPIGIQLEYTVGRKVKFSTEPTSAEQFIDHYCGIWKSSRDDDGTIEDGVRDTVIETMDTMWKDLKYIIQTEAVNCTHRVDLPDIFLHEEESSTPEPLETRAEPISADSETPIIRRRRQSY